MVTLHEAMHAALNDTTAWGSLFQAYSVLLRHASEPEKYQRISTDVVRACWRAHEVFATYAGVYMADRVAGPGLLNGHSAYQEHYRTAQELTEGLPEESRLQWHALVAAVRACMQSNALAVSLRVGLNHFKLADVRVADQPDARLEILLGEGATLWTGVIDEIAERERWEPRVASPVRAALLAVPTTAERNEVVEAALDSVAGIAERVCYERAANLLLRRGTTVLAYDGHQELTHATVAAVHALAPAGRPEFAAAIGDEHRPEQAVRSFALERLVIRNRPLAASVLRLSEMPRRGLVRHKSEETSLRHAFVVARSSRRLREQHVVSEHARSLPTRGETPVVAVREMGGDADDPALRLWVLDNPRQLAWLRRRVGGLGVVSSVSMALLADTRWENVWIPKLQAAGPVTVLFDLDPFEHFEHWASLGLPVRYASMELVGDRPTRIAFACVCDAPPYADVPFVTLVTDVTADLLTYVLATRWPGTTSEDSALIAERMDVIRVVTSHLSREETSFGFEAAPEASSLS